jgi:hypothetical protein
VTANARASAAFPRDTRNAATAEFTVKGIAASGVFDAAEMQAIYRGNAVALMPQYRT